VTKKHFFVKSVSHALATLAFVGLAAPLFAPVPQSEAEGAWQQIVAERKRMQRKSPEELKREFEERRAAENRAAVEAISRPPIDFPHYVNPRDPRARRWVVNYLQQTTAERAGIKSEAGSKKSASLVSFLVALVILAGLGLYHYTNRQASETE